jgi:hypothetical protein
MASNYVKRFGLTWNKVNNNKRQVGKYRKDFLDTLIVNFDKVMTPINQELLFNCVVVLLCMDKSYIHCNHSRVKKVESQLIEAITKARGY